MRLNSIEFDCVLVSANHAKISGLMRLASVPSYERILAPLAEAVAAAEGSFRLDLTEVEFINSSAITTLSRLVMRARDDNMGFTLVGSTGYRWQKGTFQALKALYPAVELEFV